MIRRRILQMVNKLTISRLLFGIQHGSVLKDSLLWLGSVPVGLVAKAGMTS